VSPEAAKMGLDHILREKARLQSEMDLLMGELSADRDAADRGDLKAHARAIAAGKRIDRINADLKTKTESEDRLRRFL